MTTIKPATPLPPLPPLAVDWKDASVSLFTLGGNPDTILARSGDSTKGKLFEEVARRCNAYPELVAALRNVMAGFVGDRGAHNLLGTDAGKHADDARALLAKLGEGA